MNPPSGCSSGCYSTDETQTIEVDFTLTTWLEWKITWCRAFPTLLPWVLLDQDETHHDVGACVPTPSTFDNDDHWINRLLQQMAFDEILSNHVKDSNQRISCHQDAHFVDNGYATTKAKPCTFPQVQLFRERESGNSELSPTMLPPLLENHDSNLGYGEITETAVFHVFSWIRRDHYSNGGTYDDDEEGDDFGANSRWNIKRPFLLGNNNCLDHNTLYSDHQPHDIVLDLGSGNGKVLLASALAFPFSRAIGFEIVQELHNEALLYVREWNRYHPHSSSSHETSAISTTFEFHHADLRECFMLDDAANGNQPQEWLQYVRLVWVHATVFDDVLMASVQQICEACAKGTYFCMVSKPLLVETSESKPSSLIETRAVLQLPMSWGQATVYIQQKLW